MTLTPTSETGRRFCHLFSSSQKGGDTMKHPKTGYYTPDTTDFFEVIKGK